MNKTNLGLSLLLVLGVSNFGFSEELKPQDPSQPYTPYNSMLDGPLGEEYQRYLTAQNRNSYFSRGSFIHARVDTLLTTLRNYDKSPLEMDVEANMALWAYFNAESSPSVSKEEFKKHDAFFLTEDGKVNIAKRLADLNWQYIQLIQPSERFDEKLLAERVAKVDEIKKETRELYKKLAEKLKKDEAKSLAEALRKDVQALPEIQAMSNPYGYPQGGGMMGGYGGMGGHGMIIGGGYGPDQLRASFEYSRQLEDLQARARESLRIQAHDSRKVSKQ